MREFSKKSYKYMQWNRFILLTSSLPPIFKIKIRVQHVEKFQQIYEFSNRQGKVSKMKLGYVQTSSLVSIFMVGFVSSTLKKKPTDMRVVKKIR